MVGSFAFFFTSFVRLRHWTKPLTITSLPAAAGHKIYCMESCLLLEILGAVDLLCHVFPYWRDVQRLLKIFALKMPNWEQKYPTTYPALRKCDTNSNTIFTCLLSWPFFCKSIFLNTFCMSTCLRLHFSGHFFRFHFSSAVFDLGSQLLFLFFFFLCFPVYFSSNRTKKRCPKINKNRERKIDKIYKNLKNVSRDADKYDFYEFTFPVGNTGFFV